mmetsp:Transcript_123434/g.224382  ORF Transcript_123434/g.224382 Transcript_123434/m.224382 type:complete len:211 (+) Transcript_123434:49-681(+)
MTAHFARAGKAYYELCRGLPWSSAFAVTYFKGSMSDIFAQKFLERRESTDVARNVCFATFSGLYSGFVMHFVCNLAYPRLFGCGTNLATVAKKLSTDHFIHVPFICMPCYYFWQETFFVPLENGSTQIPHWGSAVFSDTFTRWHEQIWGVMWEYWKIWTPAHVVTFKFMPEPLRVTWIAWVSALWLVVLSFLSHRDFDHDAKAPELQTDE